MVHYIGIAGTHSTGKSTFLKHAWERLSALDLRVIRIADNASKCHEAGFGILRDHTFDSTLWIMVSVIRAELEAALAADVVLVDRPVPDAIGYLEAALETQRHDISPNERHYLYTLARLHSARYSLLLKTALDSSIVLGEDRDSDLSFRKLVDEKITKSLDELQVPYHVLDSWNIEVALQLVLKTAVEESAR